MSNENKLYDEKNLPYISQGGRIIINELIQYAIHLISLSFSSSWNLWISSMNEQAQQLSSNTAKASGYLYNVHY